MIDRSAIGRTTAGATVRVERGRVGLFAKVLGWPDDGPYVDIDAARATGYPDLPVPPTLLAGLETETGDIYRTLDDLGVALGDIVNGEQAFTYHAMAFAGEELVLTTEITDIYDRRDGELEFIVRRTAVTREDELVAELRNTVVVVHGAKGAR